MNELEKIANVYGDVCLRKQRRKRQKLLIIELFLDYAKNSTLHGLRYIAERGLAIVEKLFWVATFILSVVLCSFLINNVYVKWKSCPVIVTVNERLVPVSEIPFPSVTICPQIKSKATIFNLKEKIKSLKENGESDRDTLDKIADVSMVCKYIDQVLYTTSNRYFTDENIVKHITEVAPTLKETIKCRWHGMFISCKKYFKMVYTAEGVCFNLNSLAAKDMLRNTVQTEYQYMEGGQTMSEWSLDKGYTQYYNYLSYPLRGSENVHSPTLEVLLSSVNEDSASDGLCNGLNSGYKIYLQHPTDFPQSSMYYYAAVNDQVTSLAISAHVMESTPALLFNLDSKIRQCYFPGERLLRYFKIYTAQNCRAECLSNYTYHTCNCVGYFMPHDNSSQLCAENKITCMLGVYELIALKRIYELNKDFDGRSYLQCNCLPACNSVEYDAEILKTAFNIEKYREAMTELTNDTTFSSYDSKKFSKLDMYFKKPQYVSMMRSEVFGLTDFLANIGGLLGLFLGFSFLSLVELIYFLTFRVGFTLKRDMEEEKIQRLEKFKIYNVDGKPMR